MSLADNIDSGDWSNYTERDGYDGYDTCQHCGEWREMTDENPALCMVCAEDEKAEETE